MSDIGNLEETGLDKILSSATRDLPRSSILRIWQRIYYVNYNKLDELRITRHQDLFNVNFIINMAIIHILLAQLTILWRNPAENLDRLGGLLAPLSGSAGRLLVLPEMMSTGFTEDLDALVEPPGGSWEVGFRRVLEAAALPCLLGIARRQGSEITNEALFLNAGASEPLASYRKIRLFKSENAVVTPGREVTTFEFHGVRFCPLICYDLRFPELFRAGLRQGAEVFLVIANWPDRRQLHWERLLQARAIENQAFVVGVNRCGDDPEFHYAGGSMVVDPQGKVLYHAGDRESITSVAIDVQQVRDWRAEFPPTSDYLRDPDLV